MGSLINDITQIESQRRAARFLRRDYSRETSVTLLLSQLGWSTLETRRKCARLSSFYKAVYGLSAISIQHLLRPSRSFRSTSSGVAFVNLGSRCDTLKYSFFLEQFLIGIFFLLLFRQNLL